MSSLGAAFLRDFRLRYGLTTFVETGCYLGDGIAAALEAGFGTVSSCDIDPARVADCRHRFAGDPRVCIVEGDSLSALARFLGEGFGPALFWLDAHYPAFYGLEETEATRFPVPEEFALIHRMRAGAARDVLLVDDMRVINSPDNPHWRPSEVPDYFRITHVTLAELVSPFAATHESWVDGQQEGILVMTPRKNPHDMQ